MWMYINLATFLSLFPSSSSLMAVRINAHSFDITPLSSAAVLHARTALIKSFSLIDIGSVFEVTGMLMLCLLAVFARSVVQRVLAC